MPIPQSRLIDLLAAALDYKAAFLDLSRLITAHSREVDDPQLRAIARRTIDEFLSSPAQTSTTIALESERIRLTRRYNENRRLKKSPPTVPEFETEEERLLAEQIKAYQESRAVDVPSGTSTKQVTNKEQIK